MRWSRKSGFVNAEEHKRFKLSYGSALRLSVSGFGMLLVVICVNAHGLLHLDRFDVPPLSHHDNYVRAGYRALVASCSGGLLVGLVLEACGCGRRRWVVVGLGTLQTCLRCAYVLFSCYAWTVTWACGWTLRYPLSNVILTAVYSGMPVGLNVCPVVLANVLLPACILADSVNAASVSYVCQFYSFTYCSLRIIVAQTQDLAELWMCERLLEMQRARLRSVLDSYISADLVEAMMTVINPLPCTLVMKRFAVVLHLDLCNYTALTASTSTTSVAALVQGLFLEFDALIQTLGAPCGVFKIDTVGGACMCEGGEICCVVRGDAGASFRDRHIHALHSVTDTCKYHCAVRSFGNLIIFMYACMNTHPAFSLICLPHLLLLPTPTCPLGPLPSSPPPPPRSLCTDAYQAAAWLIEESPTSQDPARVRPADHSMAARARNAEICESVLRVAGQTLLQTFAKVSALVHLL